MKKQIACLLLMISVITITSCSITGKVPEDGIYYCEKLQIEVDFSMLGSTGKCAKKYNSDGTYEKCWFLRDYGTGVLICSEDQKTEYINANYKYYKYKDVFRIVTYFDEEEYLFYRVE